MSRNDAYSNPKKIFFENYEDILGKMVWIFCPEMTLAQFPKSKFWNFSWIFCPEMTLAQIPEFGFFVRNSRIGVKSRIPGQSFVYTFKEVTGAVLKIETVTFHGPNRLVLEEIANDVVMMTAYEKQNIKFSKF